LEWGCNFSIISNRHGLFSTGEHIAEKNRWLNVFVTMGASVQIALNFLPNLRIVSSGQKVQGSRPTSLKGSHHE